MASNLFSEAHLIELCKDIQKQAIYGFSPAIFGGLYLVVLCVLLISSESGGHRNELSPYKVHTIR